MTDDTLRKYMGIKMKKKALPPDEETFPQNPALQAELDSLDNADRVRRNIIYKRRMAADKKNKEDK